MKNFLISFLILFLILFTAIIKNSTKRIDDGIFAIKENIRSLKKDYENIKLEHDYLSSAEKLLEFRDRYFEDKLVKKNIQEMKIITQKIDKFEIKQFYFVNE